MEYKVFLDGNAVGRVYSTRQGLYERFECQCRLPDRQVYRLYARCGAREECLGVLVPERGQFCLKTSIPAKRLGDGERQFWAAAGARRMPKQEEAPKQPEVPAEPVEVAAETPEVPEETPEEAPVEMPEEQEEAPQLEPMSFLPIRPGEPFAFIEELKRACLAVQDGQVGARILR